MQRYYYNHQINYRNWRQIIPTLVLLFLAVTSYSVGHVLSDSNRPLIRFPHFSLKSVKSVSSAVVLSDDITSSRLMDLTNSERAGAGLAPLKPNDKLSASALAKCYDMVANNYWAHLDKLGREPWHYMIANGYSRQYSGENLAYGFKSSYAIVKGWMNSQDHRAAILDKNYQDVGFGICKSKDFIKSGEQIIVVQHLGKQQ